MKSKLCKYLPSLGNKSLKTFVFRNIPIAILLGLGFNAIEVKAQSNSPYIVFVNGWLDCCAHNISNRVLPSLGIPESSEYVRYVPYSNFDDDDGISGNTSTSSDERFLRDGADYINNQLDRNRPLILIGHSFGGDSILKLLPRINRRIQFVAVIDPVSTGGFRSPLTRSLDVGGNVEYFFNRWQENVPFPNDFKNDGTIPCSARICDQEAQNLARNADGGTKTIQCRWDEVTCPGFVAPNPFIGRRGRRGTKQVRTDHQDLARDAYLQKTLADKILAQRANWETTSPASPSSQFDVGYFDNGATVFYSNGSSHCGFASPVHLRFYQKVNSARSLGRREPNSFGTYTGACSLPNGYFDDGASVFFSQGNGSFCGFPNPEALESHKRSVPGQPSFGRIDIDPNSFMSYTGVCQ